MPNNDAARDDELKAIREWSYAVERNPHAYGPSIDKQRAIKILLEELATCDGLRAELAEREDHNHCEICEKDVSQRNTVPFCGECYNAVVNPLVAERDSLRAEVNRLMTSLRKDEVDNLLANTRSSVISDCIEKVKAVNPNLTFGSANGSMMKNCILAELEAMKGVGDAK